MAGPDQSGADTRGDFPAGVIARLLNITERRLQQLAKQGVVPKSARGRYPLAGTIRAYIKFLQESGGSDEARDPSRMDPFKARAYYQAQHEKLMLDLKVGDLMSRVEAEREFGRLFDIMGRCLDLLPDQLEREGLVSPDGAARVEALLDRTRVELHAMVIGRDEDDGSAPQPAARA